MSPRIPTSTLALALLGACQGNAEGEPGRAGAEARGPAATDESPSDGETGELDATPRADDPEPEDPRASAVTITRATAAAEVAGEGGKSLGFNLDKISHLFALAAAAKLPSWGAAGLDGSEAKLARDDDLDTAWVCQYGGAEPCVLGLALPEPAKIEALRLYTAGGPRFRDYMAHPRVAKVRVHTAAGYVDVALPDGANHGYVRFAAPIESQTLAIEVLEVYPGKTDQRVHLAEIEIYGTDGAPRPPIELDPDYAWLSWETSTWAANGPDHTVRQLFVNFAQPGVDGSPPTSKRVFRATGVFGRGDDDYLLFERLHGTDCGQTRGSYVLFDKRNRMYYPLGELGGAGAEVYRHAGGRGFAVGWLGDGLFTIKGVVEQAGELVWKRPPGQAPATAEQGRALLREWGFEATPLARAQPMTATIPGCRQAGAGELAPLASVAKLGSANPEARDGLGDWLICEVGEDTLYASARCGAPARAYLIHDGQLIGSHEGKRNDARGLRLRRVGDRVLLELSAADGDTSTLLWAERGRLVDLAERGGAGLFVRPPAACGHCTDVWPRPSAVAPTAPIGPTDTSTLPDLDD